MNVIVKPIADKHEEYKVSCDCHQDRVSLWCSGPVGLAETIEYVIAHH